MGELIPLVPHPWDAIGPPQPLGVSFLELGEMAENIRGLKLQGDEKMGEVEDLKEEALVLEREADGLYNEADALIKELKRLPGGEEMADEWSIL